MIYNPNNEFEVKKAYARLESLIKRKRLFSIKDEENNLLCKTKEQNGYLHLILSYFGAENGYTKEYVKREFFKIVCNPEIFCIIKKSKSGLDYPDLKSWSECTKEEGIIAIDNFINWAEKNGVPMPRPEDVQFKAHALNVIEQNKDFL